MPYAYVADEIESWGCGDFFKLFLAFLQQVRHESLERWEI